MTNDTDKMVRELRDRAEVAELPLRYARGMDRRDWKLVRAQFADDAVIAGSLGTKPIGEYVEMLRGAVEAFPATMHFVGNQLVTIDGDSAFVESYCVAYHWKVEPAGKDDPRNMIVGVHYLDTAKRTGAGWLISERTVRPGWRVGGNIPQ